MKKEIIKLNVWLYRTALRWFQMKEIKALDILTHLINQDDEWLDNFTDDSLKTYFNEAIAELEAMRDGNCKNCKHLSSGYCVIFQRKMTGDINSISKSHWLGFISCPRHEFPMNYTRH